MKQKRNTNQETLRNYKNENRCKHTGNTQKKLKKLQSEKEKSRK